MNTSQPLVTHQCMNCDQHHPHHLVRQVLPAENTPEGEAEVLVCPLLRELRRPSVGGCL
ncbi:hypothetical protein N5K55_21875 [Pseudomonas aeruginosa]|nr:hypothetical protein [Pseudomonas aeruginosa]MCT7342353.1 hypothetical protein [Pseudomonas aeruginosa]